MLNQLSRSASRSRSIPIKLNNSARRLANSQEMSTNAQAAHHKTTFVQTWAWIGS